MVLLILWATLIDPTARILWTVLLLSFLNNSSTSQDIEACLGLGEHLAVLVSLKANIFVALLVLGLVDGFRESRALLLEAFCID